MEQSSCFKIDMKQLQQVRESTYKESKTQCWLSFYCLKVRQQSLVRPRAVPYQIHAWVQCCWDSEPRRAGYWKQGKHPVWDVELSCSFLNLLWEQNQKGCFSKLQKSPVLVALHHGVFCFANNKTSLDCKCCLPQLPHTLNSWYS